MRLIGRSEYYHYKMFEICQICMPSSVLLLFEKHLQHHYKDVILYILLVKSC